MSRASGSCQLGRRRASVSTGQGIRPRRGRRRCWMTSKPAFSSSRARDRGGSARTGWPNASEQRRTPVLPRSVVAAIEARMSRPPGTKTRAIPASAPAWSGYQWNDSLQVMTSIEFERNGSAMASARNKPAAGLDRLPKRSLAWRSMPSERSTPIRAERGKTERRRGRNCPVPHPRSRIVAGSSPLSRRSMASWIGRYVSAWSRGLS